MYAPACRRSPTGWVALHEQPTPASNGRSPTRCTIAWHAQTAAALAGGPTAIIDQIWRARQSDLIDGCNTFQWVTVRRADRPRASTTLDNAVHIAPRA